MEDDKSHGESASSKTSTLHVFRQFQELYAEQLKNTKDSYDGWKLKVKILENWVKDLTDQNEMLVKTVDDLEEEALKRLCMIEANIPQKPQTGCFSSREMLTPKGMDQVEALSSELEEVKQQLSEKERLIFKYQTRVEELRSLVQKEKTDNPNKIFVHRCSMTDDTAICDSDSSLDPPSVHKELETTQVQLCQVEQEVTQLKKKLKDADCSIKRLRSDLVVSEKNAREMRSALTAEVAEKHDQILALRREVAQLEDQLRQADMQTHFKDDIIKELRKEVKVARSKETLVEVLGIKERSLTHMEHLTEQLEQKEHTITCLKAKLQQTPDTLYRVKQQVDWFTENILQQCAKGNVPEEFKKCITTMLEELRESIECCNFGPTNTSETCKDSIEFVTALQNSLDQSQKSLSQSWTSIWETTHQINKMELSPLVDQWKKCLYKQQSLQQKIQELIQSIVYMISSSKTQSGNVTNSVDSLHYTLASLNEQLKAQPTGNKFAYWLNDVQCLVLESISKIQDISHVAASAKTHDDNILCELESQMQSMDSLEWELSEAVCIQQKAYEKLYKMEKTQRTKVDTLLATVLHHQEVWAQQAALSDDMKRELLGLIHCFKQQLNQNKTLHDQGLQGPVEQRSLHVKSLVTKISTDIRTSISDIEHKQSQVSHLEVSLSSVSVVLKSTQCEIHDIAQELKSKGASERLLSVLNKLKKEICNAIKKAENLTSIYNTTKKEYVKSSDRVLQIQREFDSLEEELHNFHNYICQDFNEPSKPPRCDKRICPIQAELENFKNKGPEKEDKGLKKCKPIKEQCTEMKQILAEKDAAIKNVKDNIMELKSNLKERDRMAATQGETIQILQNSLKICQKEGEELRRKVSSMEKKKCEVEKEYKKQIQVLQNKICELQNSLKRCEDKLEKTNCDMEKEYKKQIQVLQNKEKTNCDMEKEYKKQIQVLQNKICELQNCIKQFEDKTKKHQRSEAALQIVISNLKEQMCKEQKRSEDLQKTKQCLQDQLTNTSKAYKIELDKNSQRESSRNEENQSKIEELKKQAKCWSAKVAEIETQLKNIQDKLCISARHEEDLQKELLEKEEKCRDEICGKVREINKLTSAIKTLTDQLKETSTALEAERAKNCDTEQKLVTICAAYDGLKVKAKEKETTAEKLHVALTQLSNKFVTRRLDSKGCVRHYQEECAKFEALYNTTACKLHSKEVEVTSLIQENERLKRELECLALTPLQEKEEDSCPFLLERVQHLSKELQVAHSCQNSYETMIKDLTEKCSKKEEEVCQLKAQLKQTTTQRDQLLMDLEVAQGEILKLKMNNSELQCAIQKLERNKAQLTDQVKSMQRMMCESQSQNTHPPCLQPNIELQREISTVLSSQLRGVKQKLHNTRHDYKLLQSAYEELNRKYSLLQKCERDLEQPRAINPHIASCISKESKSVVHFKYSQGMNDEAPCLKGTSHSKSWHKLESSHNLDERERKWKQRLKDVIRGDGLDLCETMHNSSSSN